MEVKRPEVIFTKENFKAQYKALALRHHPDRGGDARIFDKITKLYKEAEKLFESGAWGHKGILNLDKKYVYDSVHLTETGVFYVCDNEVIYFIKKEFLPINSTIPSASFPENNMKEQFEYLTKRYSTFKDKEGDYLIFNKPEGFYSLRDFKGIELPHIAWTISRLYSIACFLTWAGFVNLDISLNSVFISPENHQALLLGNGYYYKYGEKITKLPLHTYSIIPHSSLITKKAFPNLMSEQIKALGRELLGNRKADFLFLKSKNEVIANWLTNAPKEDIFEEYKEWDTEVLVKAFGKKRFARWDITKSDIYQGE